MPPKKKKLKIVESIEPEIIEPEIIEPKIIEPEIMKPEKGDNNKSLSPLEIDNDEIMPTGEIVEENIPIIDTSLEEKQDEKFLNKYKLEKELLNTNDLKNSTNEYNYLYPDLNDPNFNIKLSERKEFYDTKYDGVKKPVEKQAEILCNADFELAPHQMFVRNFLSFQTPYNSLLLYHGLGTGKTCSAISVGEEMRDYLIQMGIAQRILVVASPNVQENFKLQLFDERKLKLVDGLWNLRACTGNKFLKEINPTNMKGLTKEKVISQIKRIINNSYLFLGYVEFANYIFKKSKVDSELSNKKKEILIKQKLKKHFNNRLIIIDEVHNIRMTDDNKNKRIAMELLKLVKNVDNLRLLLLSATPMYNSYKEIVWLINLMNENDKRGTIEVKDVFTKDGNFIIDSSGEEIGKELLERKARGYISFVRGENPYTFPYRIWPSMFATENTLNSIEYPRLQLNDKPIIQKIEMLSLYMNKIGSYQNKGYEYIINKLKEGEYSEKNMPNFENMGSFGYTLLQKPLEGLNIIYPEERLEKDDSNIDPKNLVGKNGLQRLMSYTETLTPPSRTNFEYKDEKYGRIFSPNEIGKYSCKIKSICDSIINSTGIVLIYSQYIDGGIVPMALALEELGFTRAGAQKSLFKNPPTEAIDSLTFKPRSEVAKKFHPAKYVMITGDKTLSPDNVEDMKMLTNLDNKYGEKVKVVFISLAGAEGLDFKFIRQIHVLEPWYNMNRIEQIIGRGVRTCSHKDLPFEERNVEIYLHSTILENTENEAVDLYVYRLAELKALKIGKVSRLLKQVATDCLLNIQQTEFTVEDMNQTVIQKLSSGKKIDYQVGDKPYTSICDYMAKCSYNCKPEKKINEDDINLDTYSEAFIMMNTEKIIIRIKSLFKERFFYTKEDLISEINSNKNYPLIQIYAALSQCIEDKNEYITDKYGRLGNLINIDNLYLYQPLELNNENISIYDRSIPLEYKRKNLEFILPEKVIENIMVDEDLTETNEEIKELFEKINDNLLKGSTEQLILRGETDWYKFCSLVIIKMENSGVKRELLLKFLLNHILEELTFNEKLLLLNYLENNRSTELEKKIYKFFTSQIMQNKQTTGILFEKEGKIVLIVKKLSGNSDINKWVEGEGEDYQDLAKNIEDLTKLLLPTKTKINTIVGFMIPFKKDDIVFKVKDMTKKRHTGARCDQSGKAAAIKMMNLILGEDYYNSSSDVSQKEICVLQEFTLRMFNEERKNNKIWFLTSVEAVLINIEKETF